MRRIIGIIFNKGRIGDLPPTDRGVGVVDKLGDLYINCPGLTAEDNGGQKADHENSYSEQSFSHKMAMHNKSTGDIAAISCNLTAKNGISAEVKDVKTITFPKIKQAKIQRLTG